MISKYKILFASPCSFLSEHPRFGRWLTQMAVTVTHDPMCAGYRDHYSTEHRIHIARNQSVDAAQQTGCDYIVFGDPDMNPDFRLFNPYLTAQAQPKAREWAKPFLPSSLKFMQTEACGVIGSPAISGPPDCKINVFKDRGDNVTRMSHEEYANTPPSFLQVAAIGTGLMLIDMKVFDILKKPYFEDLAHPDGDNLLSVHQSQDCRFCLKCGEAGIPVYANLYAPSGHYKLESFEPPDWSGKAA